jgi:apolipoprotein N-acyltransferase
VTTSWGGVDLLGKKAFNYILPILASVFSAVLLVLSFPSYELYWLAWLALVPLLVALSGRSPIVSFLLSCVCTMFFFAIVFSFVLKVPGYRPLHHALLDIYLGLLCALFGLVCGFIWRRCTGTVALLAAPFVWVCIEYIRANFGFLAFPWVLLSHSQYKVLPVIQIASIAGGYGVSFLIVMVNATIAACVLYLLHKLRKGPPSLGPQISRCGVVSMSTAAALLLILTLLYGRGVVSRPIAGEGIKVAVVQGNIPQNMKWDRRHAAYIMQTYTELTAEASKEKPELIVWPESATPGPIDLNKRLHDEVSRIAKQAGGFLLLGSSYHEKLKPGSGRALLNSAFLIGPESGAGKQRYDKIRLFPFGEYLPMENRIPWSWINVPKMPGFSPGKTFTLFQGPGFCFGVTICWEILFPEMIREFVKNGAQFMVNITNEAWFGETVGPYHILTASVFRAVENRVYVVRCANTGISCFINPYGRVVDRVKDDKGQDIFVRGVLTETVIPMESRTVYTRYGDWLVWICFGVSLIFISVAFLRRKPDIDTPT